MRFLKRKPEQTSYTRKEWILIAVETFICAVGMDLYGVKAAMMERAGESGTIQYFLVGLVFVFFLATAFGNLLRIYKFGVKMVEKSKDSA